jgi:hypothetical protein
MVQVVFWSRDAVVADVPRKRDVGVAPPWSS